MHWPPTIPSPKIVGENRCVGHLNKSEECTIAFMRHARAINVHDVTNLRVVHKTGFIRRRTFEMSLDKVESVDVDQSLFGRVMNYGDLTIQGVGEGTQSISTVASPLAFRNAITTRPDGS